MNRSNLLNSLKELEELNTPVDINPVKVFIITLL